MATNPFTWRRDQNTRKTIGTGSGATPVADTFPAIALTLSPSGTPERNWLYKDNIPKAWIRFNMATDAIADSFNVSSITDEATGRDTINVDRDFASGNWCAVGSGMRTGVAVDFVAFEDYTVGGVGILCRDAGGAVQDATIATMIGFGDQ